MLENLVRIKQIYALAGVLLWIVVGGDFSYCRNLKWVGQSIGVVPGANCDQLTQHRKWDFNSRNRSANKHRRLCFHNSHVKNEGLSKFWNISLFGNT